MAATGKLTKCQVIRNWQDSPTPHQVTAYAVDTSITPIPPYSIQFQASDANCQSTSGLQTAINAALTAAALPTIDYTK